MLFENLLKYDNHNAGHTSRLPPSTCVPQGEFQAKESPQIIISKLNSRARDSLTRLQKFRNA